MHQRGHQGIETSAFCQTQLLQHSSDTTNSIIIIYIEPVSSQYGCACSYNYVIELVDSLHMNGLFHTAVPAPTVHISNLTFETAGLLHVPFP